MTTHKIQEETQKEIVEKIKNKSREEIIKDIGNFRLSYIQTLDDNTEFITLKLKINEPLREYLNPIIVKDDTTHENIHPYQYGENNLLERYLLKRFIVSYLNNPLKILLSKKMKK